MQKEKLPERLLLSENQHSLLRKIQKPLAFPKAMEVNRTTLFSLLNRGFIQFDQREDVFKITSAGSSALSTFNFSNRIWVNPSTASNVKRAESIADIIISTKKRSRKTG